eukprot:4579659-Prorocentrum_lima.AAC.1
MLFGGPHSALTYGRGRQQKLRTRLRASWTPELRRYKVATPASTRTPRHLPKAAGGALTLPPTLLGATPLSGCDPGEQ